MLRKSVPAGPWLCALALAWGAWSAAAAEAPVGGELIGGQDEGGVARGVLLNLDQIFIPTVASVSGEFDDGEADGGRHDLPDERTEDASPGILTIGTESPWEDLLRGDGGRPGSSDEGGEAEGGPAAEGSASSQSKAEEAEGGDAAGAMGVQEKPYGTWSSPVTSEMVTKAYNKIDESPQVDPVTGNVFWSESLSNENGINAVFHFDPESRAIVRWTSRDINVWTRVNGYGGGAFTVYNHTLFFSNFEDNAIYRQDGPEGIPQQLTNTSYRRYADGSYSPQLDALFLVVEDHELELKGEATEPECGIVMVDARNGTERVVVAHADFFASPRVSQDGRLLVWVQWNHPQMPWGETRMFVGEIKYSLGKVAIAKYFQHGSMMTPSFDQNNQLYYVHDSTGWWNLYQVTRRNFERNLTPQSQEVGWPMWYFGRQAYAVNPRLGADEVVAICGHDLTVVDLVSLERRVLKTGYAAYTMGVAYSLDGSKVYTVAADSLRGPRLVEVNVSSGEATPLGRWTAEGEEGSDPGHPVVDPHYISVARQIQFPTTQGDFAYGYLYMPKNKDYRAPPGTRPPLLVKAHGGPTAAATKTYSAAVQFFTSRGFAILDVDYRGSTGYGTLYRTKLHEMWGVYDVDDVLAGADYLVQEGLVDPERLCIDGGSAGGYTALSALTITGSKFKAGESTRGSGSKFHSITNTFKENLVMYLRELSVPWRKKVRSKLFPKQQASPLRAADGAKGTAKTDTVWHRCQNEAASDSELA
ncbi:uncharacterized protein LOC134771928 [Penaeus indicus]|uniref:uncharacterized protein LOC134771928 n=1 Tax=Penaeus indicus TaxID=29960 RepID=UPI00300D527A